MDHVKGLSRGLCVETGKYHGISLSGKSVSLPRFEMGTFRKRHHLRQLVLWKRSNTSLEKSRNIMSRKHQ
jgi:hypothetical protein